MRGRLLRQAIACTVVTVLAASCSSDSTGNGGNPTLSIQLSATTLSLAQGASGSITATITRGGGFNGSVALTVTGAPSGVTATPALASLGSGVTSTAIAIAVGSAVAANTYTLTVRATGSGVQDATATLALTVTAATQPGFTFALAPNALTIQQGSQNTATINITRTGGFAGTVNLSVTGAPAGMTATPNPAGTTGNTSTLTVVVGASVATGNHTLTVTATGTGVANQTASLTVTVTSSGAGGNTTVRFCAGFNLLPVFFAFQDGTGPWTPVTGVNNVYTFNLASGRGGYAYVIAIGTVVYNTAVLFGTQAELNQQSLPACPAAPATKNVLGSVANVGATELAFIALGNAAVTVFPSVGTNFTITLVRDGVTDLFATRATQMISGASVVNSAIIRRSVNPAAGSTMAVLDFNAVEAFTPVMRSLTLNNLGGDAVSILDTYSTAAGTVSNLLFETQGVASANRQYLGVPAANGQTGDLHTLILNAGTGTGTTRSLIAYFKDAVDKTFTFGPTIGAVTVTAPTTTPNALLRAQYTLQPEYNRYLSVNYGQTTGGTTRAVSVSATAAYLGSASAFDMTIPNLSPLTGFNTTWGLAAGVSTNWSFSGFAWTGAGVTSPPLIDGAILTYASRTGSITP